MTEHMTAEKDQILKETVTLLQENLPASLSDITLEKVAVGVFFTGVKISNGYGGICYTPVDLIPEAVCCTTSASAMPYCGEMEGVRVLDFLAHIHSPAPLVRAVIISIINALSAWYLDICPEGRYKIEYDTDAFDLIDTSDQANPVIIVGALWPVVHRLKQKGIPYRIFELNKAALRDDELPFYVSPEEQEIVIAKAGCVVMTGATIVTSTLEGLLVKVPPKVPVIIGGPTVSIIPDQLFSRGVTAIGGVKVTDPDRLIAAIMQGGSGYHFFDISAEKMTIRR